MRNINFKGVVILLSAILCLGLVLCLLNSSRKRRGPKAYDRIIRSAAMRHNVDDNLIKAIIKQESQFNPNARGRAKEIGLMQITPSAAKDWEIAHRRDLLSEGSLFDPQINIEIGTWYLGNAIRQWRGRKEVVIMALIQYNAGRSRALKWDEEFRGRNMLDNIPFQSTRNYIRNVLKYHTEFTNQGK